MNRDLTLVLEAMLRQANHSWLTMNQVPPFAAFMTAQSNISFLFVPAQSVGRSLHSRMQTLEAGLVARIGQTTVKALGICSETDTSVQVSVGQPAVQMFLEHFDGSSYRTVIPCVGMGVANIKGGAAVSMHEKPRFFADARWKSA